MSDWVLVCEHALACLWACFKYLYWYLHWKSTFDWKRRSSVYVFILPLKVPHLEKNEVAYVVGNLPELGAWNHNQAILMTQEHNSQRESPVLFDSNSSGEFYSEDRQDNAADGIFDEEGEE